MLSGRRLPGPSLLNAALWLSALFVSATAASAQTSTQDLKRMSLQDLMNIEVTTASKTPESASNVPAAIFVITQADIRRSGATSIPEVLRLAPGVQVARINAGTWAIGIRGFADRLARSVLVLIDGRAVYSPLFAGTYWENQDTLLADVDRIEVIRGPGGTLWGANAVDGIINIITKRTADTQGWLAGGGAGSEDRAFGGVRYGGRAGDSGTYRAYVKGFDRDSEFHPDGNEYDFWRTVQAGFRSDWTTKSRRAFTIQGDAYDGRLGEYPTVSSYTPPYAVSSSVAAPISGANVLARFNSAPGGTSDVQLQAYFDRTNRDELPVAERRNTFDLDFQQSVRRWNRHALVWGAGYRVTSGSITAVAPTAFVPSERTDSLYTAFAQDEMTLAPGRWRLTFGAKLEHNDYSGFEIQPTVRVLWTPAASQTVFAAVTRAVRTPSRVETDYTTISLTSASPLPTFVRLEPNPEFVSERVLAYEAGYRVRPIAQAFITVSAFYNRLSDILSTDLHQAFVESAAGSARLILPVMFENGLHGSSYGGEITSDLRVLPWWRLSANYSYLTILLARNPGHIDVASERRDEGLSPHHLVQLGSSFDLQRGWSIDWQWRYVSSLAAGPVPAYSASTFSLGWAATPQIQFAVVGQDLFSAHHLEWPAPANAPVEINRSVYARVIWRR